MVGTVQDITEQQFAIEALRASDVLLRIAGQTAKLGGWSLLLPKTLTWSDQVCAIHEVPLGTTPPFDRAIQFYAPEFRKIISDAFELCIRDGTPFDLELQIVTAKGQRLWVRAIGGADRDASGAITMIRGALQDINELRKLQEQYRQAQKMEAVGRLAAGVAHDFNNLLSVILSYAQFAIEDLRAGDPLRSDMLEIDQACRRATELTKQLLAFSRQQILRPRVVQVDTVLMPMERMLRRLLGEDVALTVVCSATGRVLADPGQLEQVVMNLVVNARDAMPAGGSLTLETSDVHLDAVRAGRTTSVAPGDYVMLAISDTGVGMDATTAARVFEPFFTTKPSGRGTGLGLSTVFGIVQQSGGCIEVHSELAHGTTFKVYFPITETALHEAIAEQAPALLRGSEVILLVEDEDQVRAVASTILRRNGYQVLDTSNGGEALLVCRNFDSEIHLLLTDVVMPRMSGRHLAEELALQRPQMKVLYASGYTDDAIIQHGVLEADVAFISKPFTPDSLLRKVRHVLDARAKG